MIACADCIPDITEWEITGSFTEVVDRSTGDPVTDSEINPDQLVINLIYEKRVDRILITEIDWPGTISRSYASSCAQMDSIPDFVTSIQVFVTDIRRKNIVNLSDQISVLGDSISVPLDAFVNSRGFKENFIPDSDYDLMVNNARDLPHEVQFTVYTFLESGRLFVSSSEVILIGS
jgi:hypothetical protein